MDTPHVGFPTNIPPLTDYVVFIIHVVSVLFVTLLIIKAAYLAIKRKQVRNHKMNFRIAAIPEALFLVFMLSKAFSAPNIGSEVLLAFLIYLVPLLILYVVGFGLLEFMDFIISLGWRERLLVILPIITLTFYFYPRSMISEQITDGHTKTVTTCKCDGIATPYSHYCFGLIYPCSTTKNPYFMPIEFK